MSYKIKFAKKGQDSNVLFVKTGGPINIRDCCRIPRVNI